MPLSRVRRPCAPDASAPPRSRLFGKDTLVATHSGLGHLVRSWSKRHGTNAPGNAQTHTVDSEFAYDALAHMHWERHTTSLATASGFGAGGSNFMATSQWTEFDAATGRITVHKTLKRHDAYVHDEAGNVQFSYTSWWNDIDLPKPPREDRASFYSADDRLKQVDYRWVQVPHGENQEWKRVVEVYRYDPLGRRVLVRTYRSCRLNMLATCRLGTIRRTIWDGDQELHEIQMPGDSLTSTALVENDTGEVHLAHDQVPYSTEPFDRNPFFGRVAYTYGLALDQPLSITQAALTTQAAGNGRSSSRRAGPPHPLENSYHGLNPKKYGRKPNERWLRQDASPISRGPQ